MTQVHDQIRDKQGKYFTIMLNMADDELDPYQYRLLAHYVRVGTCWQSVRTTAAACKMSVGKVVATRQELARLGYIALAEHISGTYQVTILDRMVENTARYQPSADERTVQVANDSVQVANDSVHQVKQRRTREQKPVKKDSSAPKIQAHIAIIDAWFNAHGDAAPAVKTRYGGQYLAFGSALAQAGVTAEQVTAFVAEKRNEPFYQDKIVDITYTAKYIRAWIRSRANGRLSTGSQPQTGLAAHASRGNSAPLGGSDGPQPRPPQIGSAQLVHPSGDRSAAGSGIRSKDYL